MDRALAMTRWLLNTCLPTANPSPASLAVATCDRLTVVISISHVRDLLRTEDVHLHTPALRIGTHFLLTLETVVFLFHLLSTISKPFSSLSTRLAHAARLGFFYKKTRYINSLLLLWHASRAYVVTVTDSIAARRSDCCNRLHHVFTGCLSVRNVNRERVK